MDADATPFSRTVASESAGLVPGFEPGPSTLTQISASAAPPRPPAAPEPPVLTLRAAWTLMVGTGLVGLSLLFLRILSAQFFPGTTTADHPVFAAFAALVAGGLVWMALFPVLARIARSGSPARVLVWGGLAAGLLFRALFFDTYAIYEDDFRRYLWDGAVVLETGNPFEHSPTQALQPPDPADSESLAAVKRLAQERSLFPAGINNPDLTTIYPSTAQAAFALAAWVGPLDPDALRGVFLLVEAATFVLLLKALQAYGRHPIWVLAYALCPLVAFAGFNTLHMDILLVPFVLGAMLLVGRRPVWAAVSLGLAVGVKVWPLVLGPVLFRQYRHQPLRFVAYGAVLGLVGAALLWPIVAELGDDSGLGAYSETWVRSSFLFPLFADAIAGFVDDPGRTARLAVAGAVSAVALGLALIAKPDPQRLPLALLAVTATLLFLSPTGYPWYAIWVALFLPFVPSWGVALLCVTVSLYYVRFWLGEGGRYSVYTDILVPIQFGLPLLVIAWESWRARGRAAREDTPEDPVRA